MRPSSRPLRRPPASGTPRCAPPRERSTVVNGIVTGSFAVLPLAEATSAALGLALDAAEDFFARPPEEKARYASSDENFGYRAMGREYSIAPERPDLNDCFTLWSDRRDLVPRSTEIASFLDALLDLHEHLARVTEMLLTELAITIGGDRSVAPSFRRASHIQVNDYRRAPDEREFLQERHEDGHIVTLWHARQPGLEILTDRGARPITLAESEIAVFAGSALTTLSGGVVAPLEHQVRNLGLNSRHSLMYFVNPELTVPILPWRGAGDDMRPFIQKRPNAFGLPDVPAL